MCVKLQNQKLFMFYNYGDKSLSDMVLQGTCIISGTCFVHNILAESDPQLSLPPTMHAQLQNMQML